MDSEHDAKVTSEKPVKGKRPNFKARIYTEKKADKLGREYNDAIGWIEFSDKEDDAWWAKNQQSVKIVCKTWQLTLLFVGSYASRNT